MEQKFITLILSGGGGTLRGFVLIKTPVVDGAAYGIEKEQNPEDCQDKIPMPIPIGVVDPSNRYDAERKQKPPDFKHQTSAR